MSIKADKLLEGLILKIEKNLEESEVFYLMENLPRYLRSIRRHLIDQKKTINKLELENLRLEKKLMEESTRKLNFRVLDGGTNKESFGS